MATEKNFRVKKGLDVKSGVVTVENLPTSNAADLVVLKDGTNEIGKIKYSADDNLAIYASATGHAGINFIESAIIPMSAGAETNDAISLGDSTRAFKDLHLSGDLHVAGAINSTATSATNLEIEDITITLNKSDSDSSSAANGAGIVIQDAVDASTDASILWNTTNDEFDFSNGITVNGDISLPDHVNEDTENSIVEDSAKIKLGAGDDLEIYHDGVNRIDSDGNLWISTFGASQQVNILDKSTDPGKYVARFGRNGLGNPSVRLYEDGNIQVELSSGVTRFHGTIRIDDGNDFTNIVPTVDTGIKGQALKYGDANKAILQFDAPAWTLFTGHDPDGTGAGAAIDAELLRMTAGGNFGVGTFSDAAEPTHHLHLMSSTTNTNSAEDIVKIESKSSGTTTAGFGANILFNAERADGTQQDQGRIGFIANVNDGTGGAEVLSSDFVIGTATGGTITNKVWVKDDGRVGLGTSFPDANSRLHIKHSFPRIVLQKIGTNQKGTFEQSGGTLGFISQNNTAKGSIQFRGYDGTDTVNYATFNSSGVFTLGDIIFPTAKGTAGQSLVMNAGATALEFGSPTVDNITKDNTSVAITDNGTDAGSITATVDGTAIAVIDGDGITVTGDVEASEFIGDVRGAVLFKAKASENLAKGDVVYIDQYDATGNKTQVAKANASDAAKMPAFGVVAAAANANANVNVYTFGTLTGLDTSSFSVNDELYVSAATAGALTDTAPTGNANLIQKIAKVTRSHASSGSIKIMGAGRTNATPNLDEGKIFVGNVSNQSTQVDDTLEVDMANSEVRAISKLHVFPNSPLAGKKSILELDAPNAKQTIRQTLLRNSDNATYSGGDATGFDYFDAIVAKGGADDAMISLYHTTGSTASDNHIETIRLRSDGTSYIQNELAVGTTVGLGGPLTLKKLSGSTNLLSAISTNTGTSDGDIFSIEQIVNGTTNTTVAGELTLKERTAGSGTTKITLSADADTTSSIGGDLDVVDVFTAGNIASDDKIATGSYILPNAIGTAGQVLAYPAVGTELEWVTRGVDFDEVPSAMQTLARTMGWVPGYNNNVESSAIWNIDENALEFTTEASASTGVVHKAFFVRAGESINVSLPIKGDTTAGNAGVNIYLYQYRATSTLPAGKTHVVDSASYSTAQQAAAGFAGGDNGYDANSGNWQTFSISQASVDEDTWISLSVTVTSSYINGGIRKLYLKDPHIEVSSATKQDMIALQYIFG